MEGLRRGGLILPFQAIFPENSLQDLPKLAMPVSSLAEFFPTTRVPHPLVSLPGFSQGYAVSRITQAKPSGTPAPHRAHDRCFFLQGC